MQTFIQKVTKLHSRLLRLERGFHVDEIQRDAEGATVKMHDTDDSEIKYTARITKTEDNHFKVTTKKVEPKTPEIVPQFNPTTTTSTQESNTTPSEQKTTPPKQETPATPRKQQTPDSSTTTSETPRSRVKQTPDSSTTTSETPRTQKVNDKPLYELDIKYFKRLSMSRKKNHLDAVLCYAPGDKTGKFDHATTAELETFFWSEDETLTRKDNSTIKLHDKCFFWHDKCARFLEELVDNEQFASEAVDHLIDDVVDIQVKDMVTKLLQNHNDKIQQTLGLMNKMHQLEVEITVKNTMEEIIKDVLATFPDDLLQEETVDIDEIALEAAEQLEEKSFSDSRPSSAHRSQSPRSSQKADAPGSNQSPRWESDSNSSIYSDHSPSDDEVFVTPEEKEKAKALAKEEFFKAMEDDSDVHIEYAPLNSARRKEWEAVWHALDGKDADLTFNLQKIRDELRKLIGDAAATEDYDDLALWEFKQMVNKERRRYMATYKDNFEKNWKEFLEKKSKEDDRWLEAEKIYQEMEAAKQLREAAYTDKQRQEAEAARDARQRKIEEKLQQQEALRAQKEKIRKDRKALVDALRDKGIEKSRQKGEALRGPKTTATEEYDAATKKQKEEQKRERDQSRAFWAAEDKREADAKKVDINKRVQEGIDRAYARAHPKTSKGAPGKKGKGKKLGNYISLRTPDTLWE